ncbi:MAG TPA: DPP IV N-terminal domain-containing protein [bacterium]|nr:DPP IV N-terminal domain-containing protein [bacterium]
MAKLSLPIIISLLAVMAIAMVPQEAEATFLLWDDGVNHWEIDWKYTETEHFVIYWYPEEENTARQLLAIAEDIYEHDSRIWNYELTDKIVVVLLDTEDYANGFAAHNFNWITIWASHLYDVTRGRTDWLADCFSHELGHIISLKAGSVFRENMLGILIGGSRTSRKYNFDMGAGLLYGTETLPTWMVEGAAQFSSMTYGADPYDTHREMLVRGAVIDDHLLSMDEMDIIYDKNSLQAEMVYNQGFSMNAWIGETWGLDAPARMWHEVGVGAYPTYHRMLKKELGVDRETLYNQWKAYLYDKYNKQIGAALAVSDGKEVRGRFLRLFETDPIVPEKEMSDNDRWLIGITNSFVQYSPDGKYISLLSSHGTQRRGAYLYLKNMKPDPEVLNDTKIKQVTRVTGGYGWHPDGKKIVYAAHKANQWTGHYYCDLFVYDVEKKSTERITWNQRAMQPVWSPDGTKIAFLLNGDGSLKLAVMRYPKLSGHYLLIDYDDDTQIGSPCWSPDGTKLAFLMYRKKQQDVWVINSDGTGLRPVTYDKHDNRDPGWLDNNTLLFSSDRTGIFNIYSANIHTHKVNQITNVKTGAFFPWANADGTSITYTYFTSYGYRPYEITKDEWLDRPVEDFEFNVTDEEVRLNLTTSEPLPEIHGNDYSVYDGFAGLFPILYEHSGTWVWIPLVNYDDARLQVGAQLIMVDAVERNLVFFYVMVGEESRYSMFYENYMSPVTLFASLHRIFPSIATDFQFFNFDVKANFDASFFFIGMRYLLFGDNNLSLFYSYQDIRVEQPSMRSRQITGRALNFSWDRDSVYRYAVDGGINPRGGSQFNFTFSYASPKLSEPFTGTPMGTDLADFYKNPAVIDLSEARQYPDQEYLLPDYGYWQAMMTYRNYLPFPFWDLAPLNDKLGGMDWSKLNFERWKRQRHTLVLKFMGGLTHSTVPEGYGWGNSYGRVNFYDRFHGGGMWVSGLGAYSDNGAFLGYENYSLDGETMAIAGFDYRFPILREINVGLWAFYFDKLYGAVFGDVGNLWAHVQRKQDMWNMNKMFDKSGNGQFDYNEDLLTDIGIEVRMSMYLFSSGWDSFVKVAHGFNDNEREERPLRFYIGLGTGFDDR